MNVSAVPLADDGTMVELRDSGFGIRGAKVRAAALEFADALPSAVALLNCFKMLHGSRESGRRRGGWTLV